RAVGLREVFAHEERTAPRAPSGLHVAPAVAHDGTPAEVEPAIARGIDEHPGRWLATRTAIGVVVVADTDVIEPQCGRDDAIHLLDRGAGEPAARDVGLIRHHNERVAARSQQIAGFLRAGNDLEVLGVGGRPDDPVRARGRAIQHAVAIEEHGAASGQRRASHVAFRAASDGCETRRCHSTAWNPSVCGVTVSARGFGTITTASPNFAVAPPSRPTIPPTRAPTRLASSTHRTRFMLRLRAVSPPPTEKTSNMSSFPRRLTLSHST